MKIHVFLGLLASYTLNKRFVYTRVQTKRLSTIHIQLEHKNKEPYTQPSEPIIFTKLRIYSADFPYLLCPIDQRLLTLET